MSISTRERKVKEKEEWRGYERGRGGGKMNEE